MASEKIDSPYFKRQENLSIVSRDIGMGPNRQKWQILGEGLLVESL